MRVFMFVCIVAATAPAILLPPAAAAGDGARGEGLYENHCIACHTSDAHTRDGRKAWSRESLRGWVSRWQEHLALGWNAEDIDDVTTYLDRRYYKFE